MNISQNLLLAGTCAVSIAVKFIVLFFLRVRIKVENSI